MTNTNEKAKVKELYELYGFTVDKETPSFCVFTYSNGYFDNAEIVVFDKNKSIISEIEMQYQEIGYSVRNIDYSSINKTHELLFNGFFDIEKINARLKREYQSFCDLQTNKLFNAEYEYVVPSYSWDQEPRNSNLTQDIINQLNTDGAQLIILEAAAGYGKTCTSYEIINSIANSNSEKKAPIFTELSKNRKATLFRYVLLDEIDKKFTSLSSKLVLHEIEQGNVPLIIDGFDELISRSNTNMSSKINETDEDVQTMLDTIAELFKEGCNCKVVLTSRKSSIFTGEAFDDWAEQKLSNCNITRVAIAEPTIMDWLGGEKTKFLESQKIPFASVVNPILLSFMRSMNMDTFKEQCKNVENVINYYFQTLLHRERERQALSLNEEEQYNVLKKLAHNFVEYEIISEEISFIRDLFLDIIHDRFNEYRDRYINVEEKPTEEEFANKLAGHALLNRISSTKNDIGFINDFIFGIFIGEVMIEHPDFISTMNPEFIDIACTAYASRCDEEKEKIYSVLSDSIERLSPMQQFDTEIKLTSTIKHNYYGHFIRNFEFGNDIYFDGSYEFKNCTFKNCTFHETYLTTSAFSECTFISCRFYNPVIWRDTCEHRDLIFLSNCTGHDFFEKEASYTDSIAEETNYEKIILRKYWTETERYSKGRIKEVVLLKSNTQDEREQLEHALENLKREDILSKEGHYWYLNKEKISKILSYLEK